MGERRKKGERGRADVAARTTGLHLHRPVADVTPAASHASGTAGVGHSPPSVGFFGGGKKRKEITWQKPERWKKQRETAAATTH